MAIWRSRASRVSRNSRTFSIAHTVVSSESVDESCEGAPEVCAAVPSAETVFESFPEASISFDPRMYLADASDVPVSLIEPCAEPGCINDGMVRTYRINPRAGVSQIPRYIVSAWLRDAKVLRPSSAAHPFAAPCFEFDYFGHQYTGNQADVSYCTATIGRGFPRVMYCTQRAHYKKRQSIDSFSLQLKAMTFSFSVRTLAGSPPAGVGAASRSFSIVNYSDSE